MWRYWPSEQPHWDHDHRAFCRQKFGPRPDAIDAGWITDDDGAWICSMCFADFRDRFRWTTGEEQPPP